MNNLFQLSKEELLNHAKYLAAEDHRISLQLVECLRENRIQESAPRSGNARSYISVATRRSLWRRAQGQCERVNDNGIRCSSRYKLEIDHVIPLASRGSNDISNLRYTCRQCNLYEAQKILGPRLMKNYVPFLG